MSLFGHESYVGSYVILYICLCVCVCVVCVIFMPIIMHDSYVFSIDLSTYI